MLSLCLALPDAWPDELRATYPTAVGDAPYLSRKHWVRVLLDGEVPDDELGELVEQSYSIVVAGLPKAQRPGSRE